MMFVRPSSPAEWRRAFARIVEDKIADVVRAEEDRPHVRMERTLERLMTWRAELAL